MRKEVHKQADVKSGAILFYSKGRRENDHNVFPGTNEVMLCFNSMIVFITCSIKTFLCNRLFSFKIN